MPRRPPALLAVLALVAALLAACGGDDGSQEPEGALAAAAVKTAEAGSAKVVLRGSASAAGRRVPISGDGTMDFDDPRARLRLGTELPAVGRVDVDTLLDGTNLYVRAGGLTSLLLGGRSWAKIDLSEAAAARGAGLDWLGDLARSGGPGQWLAWLALTGNPREVGSATVGGADTTHFRAEVDATRLARTVDPDVRRSLEALGVGRVPVEAWIDGDDLVRRLRVVIRREARPRLGLDLTMEFSDFGARVAATPPAEGDVRDVTALARTGLRLFG
jgi:hypothetical protein